MGGAAVFSAIRDDKRAEEKHAIEMQILKYKENAARDEAAKAGLELLQKKLELFRQAEKRAKSSQGDCILT